jgi:hypothetical protein
MTKSSLNLPGGGGHDNDFEPLYSHVVHETRPTAFVIFFCVLQLFVQKIVEMSAGRGVIAYTGPPPLHSSLPPLPFVQDGRQVADGANWTYPANFTRGGRAPSPEDITLHILRFVS